MISQQPIPTYRSSAFTLMELLIVITIIALLASMTLGATVMIKEKAKEYATQARMQAVLNGLTTYASIDGSSAYGLQTAFNLGGVTAFAPIKQINDSVAAGCAKPPGFRSWQLQNYQAMNTPAALWPAGGFWPAGWTDMDATNYGATPERKTLWRRLIDEVVDVSPPSGATWAVADYSDPTKGGWPSQWPETDWDNATPGANPPILRFPWGKPGLRIDGTLCNPNADSTDTGNVFTEFMVSGGRRTEVNESIMNRWATFSTPVTTRLWNWTSDGAGQTDSVALTAATRSDGTSVASVGTSTTNSNVALPFDMGWMSPLSTVSLLQAAGVLRQGTTGQDDYRNGRKTTEPWNDAWGHPLVVVYALFQPERYVRTFDQQNRRDLLLKAALKVYQYNRSLYFAVGAAGGSLPSTLPTTWAASADATALRDYWLQIRDVSGAAAWNETAFLAQPWKGLKRGKKNGYTCYVSTPTEVK